MGAVAEQGWGVGTLWQPSTWGALGAARAAADGGHVSTSLLRSKASSHREKGWKKSRKLIKAVPLSRDN